MLALLFSLAFAEDPDPAAAQQAAKDERAIKDIRSMKDYFAQQRDMRSLGILAQTMRMYLETGLYDRAPDKVKKDVTFVLNAVDTNLKHAPAGSNTLLTHKAFIQHYSHDDVNAVTTAEAALAVNWDADPAKILFLSLEGRGDDMVKACGERFASAPEGMPRLMVMSICEKWDKEQKWASAADKKALADARKAEFEYSRDLARSRSASSGSTSGSSASSGSSGSSGSSSASSGRTSVTLHSDCSRTLKVRQAKDTSGYGSGTTLNISSNTTSSYSLSNGESLCILDASGKATSCWTASGGSPRLTITSSCTGFSQ